MIVDEFKLSPIQEGMLFHSLSGDAAGVDIEQIVIGYHEPLNAILLEQAWGLAIERHPVLRTSFEWNRSSDPVQQVCDRAPIRIAVRVESDDEAVLEDFLAADRVRGFDLSQAPLMRLTLFDYGQDRYRLVWTFHHILLDGRGLVVVLNDVDGFYERLSRGETVVAEPGLAFHPYIEWLQTLDLEGADQFWAERLSAIAGPTPLLFDSDAQRGKLRGNGSEQLRLDEATTSALREVATRFEVTLNTIVMGVWALILSRYSGEQQVLFGATKTTRRGSIAGADAVAGLFLNTLPIRANLVAETPLVVALQELRAEWLGLRAYEHTPLTKIKDASGLGPSASLFDSLVVFENQDFPTELAATTERWKAREWRLIEQTNFPLTFAVYGDPGMLLKLEFDRRKFTRETAHRILMHCRQLFESIAANPQQEIGELTLLTPSERQQLLVEWNATERAYPCETSLAGLVEAQVERTSDAIAVVYGEQHLSYGELNQRANQLAHFLIEKGAGPDVPVAIYVDRTVNMLVGLLGILKSGSAYVPIDPGYPRERMKYVLEDVKAQLVVTESALSDQLPDFSGQKILLDADWPRISQKPTGNPGAKVSLDHLAYVLYTSGSTGRPKGVALEHRTPTTFVRWALETFALQELAGVLCSTSICFDVSMFEIFVTLSAGGRVILAPNLLHLSTLPARNQVTLINAVPSAMRELLRSGEIPASVLTVNLAGEAVPEELVGQIFTATQTSSVNNLYGPTETSYATWTPLAPGGKVTIGKPIANTRVYVLDPRRNPTPIGIPGELYIAGDGVARGYFNAPEMTAARFIADPFDTRANRMMYKTGDLVRWEAVGCLEFLGRADDQVKIRGFRIELGEVEAALEKRPEIAQAIVVVREDTPGDKRLVAYVVSDAALEWAALRTGLKETLPDYMVPSALVQLERMPLTPNGKPDRRHLPVPTIEVQPGYEPRTYMEVLLAEIWEDILRINSVGASDNFFELGGHSLLAMRMVSRVSATTGVKVPLAQIFSNPTIETFARVVETAVSGGERALPGPRASVVRPTHIPLSFSQQRLWFLDQLEPGSSFYNTPVSWRLRGTLNRTALEAALTEIVARHEVLRTRYVLDGSEAVQLICAPAAVALAVHDLSDVAEAKREARARAVVDEEANRPFALEQGPVFRASLVKLSDQDHVLVLNTHHIATDGWSLGVLRQELSALYAAFAVGQPSPLPALELQYADYALWQRSHVGDAELERQIEYWKEHLEGAPPSIDLPTDKPRPAVQTYRGASQAALLPVELVDGLKGLSCEQGATLYMTLLAAFGVLLSRYSGQQDIVVGSAIAGRTERDTEKLIGLFVNSLALRIDLSGAPGFDTLLERVRATTIGAYSHQDVPFEKLVEELNPVRDSSRSPLYQVMLILQNLPAQQTRMPGLELSVFGAARETSQMDLLLNLVEHADGIRATLIYNTDLFERGTIRRMLAHYRRLLESVVAEPAVAVAEAPLLSEAEIEQLTRGWNQTVADYPREQCVHGLIAAQAAARRDATAVVFGRERLSYGELEERSNRLARHLAARGIGPGDRVGVYLDCSLELMVSLLGVMKSGAAYVPLDTHYPSRRVESILEDATVKCLLTRSALKERLKGYGGELLLIDGEARAIARQPATAFASPATPDDLVYIIFTSGSTGRPKGVEIPHRALVNLLTAMAKDLAMGAEDVFPALASVSFDMSVPELYLALATGGTLALAEAHLAGNGEELARFLRQHRATVVHATPTTWALLLDAGFTAQGLKRCIGAEPLPQRVFERLMAAAPGTPLWNFYGPTETTVWSTVQRFTKADEPIVVGRPLANQQVYILDQAGQLCPVGVAGEIHIAGDGVARGYCGRPDLTAEKFVPDPFAADPSARMYRTSDLGRWTEAGTIEHMGRTDQQVKVRGFRIELGEIEAALTAQPGVGEAVAMVREDNPGDKRLVAYIVAVAPLEWAALRAALKETLPDYMVPSAFVRLERMPLNSNGKVDRLHLPAPDGDAQAAHEGHEPRTYMEVLIAEIWKEVLKIDSVKTSDDFFVLGGHSLLATQMVLRVTAATGIKVPVIEIFVNPALETFARTVEAAVLGGDRALPGPRSGIARPARLPVSFAQHRLWIAHQMSLESGLFNVPLALRLRGVLDVECLRSAINQLISRHEALRTRFVEMDGSVFQDIVAEVAVELPAQTLEKKRGETCERALDRMALEAARGAFDLAHDLPIRASLVRADENDHTLVVVAHHIAIDGWSIHVMLNEMCAIYDALSQGRPAELPELPIQYADYAIWQREALQGERLQGLLDYWRKQLAGAPDVIAMPMDHERPSEPTYSGGQLSLSLPRGVAQQLEILCRQQGCTMFMLLCAGFMILLSRYTGEEDLIVGTDLANRRGHELEGLVGFFVNVLPLRVKISGDPAFTEVLEQVRNTALGAYAHQEMPFDKIVEDVCPGRNLGQNPLVQVIFVMQNTPQPLLSAKGLELELVDLPRKHSRFDLGLFAREMNGEIILDWQYSNEIFKAGSIAYLAQAFLRLMESIAASPQEPMSALLASSGLDEQLVKPKSDRDRERLAEQIRIAKRRTIKA